MISEPFPNHLNHELIAKNFLNLTEEHYPTSDKVLNIVSKMGIDSVKGKIAVLNLMRDAVREVSPARLYRSIQHRDDLFMAIIEALEELEDELEELEENADDDEKTEV